MLGPGAFLSFQENKFIAMTSFQFFKAANYIFPNPVGKAGLEQKEWR